MANRTTTGDVVGFGDDPKNLLKLAHAVRRRWPPAELLVASAFGDTKAEDLPERGRFLTKPYDVAALSEAFRQMAAHQT